MAELELKFDVPADRRAAVESDVLALPAPHRERLVSIYVDTDDRSLARHRVALRLRCHGDRWEQTLKAAADSPVDRHEENVARPGDWPPEGPPVDIAQHIGTAAFDRLLAALADSRDPTLRPVFVSDFVRLSANVERDGALIELAFDEGELRGGRAGDHAGGGTEADAGAEARTLPIRELELELKRGSPRALIGAASEWADRHGLWLNTISKAARGDRLARGGDGGSAATTARIADLPRGRHIDSRTLLRRWTAVCLEQVLDNASLIASSPGSPPPEAIHQLRVGIRRLRSVWRELGDRAPDVGDAWQPAVRELFAAAGQVRDRDEAVARFAPAIGEAGGPSSPPNLPHDADPDLSALIQGQAFQHAMRTLLAFSLEADRDIGGADGGGPKGDDHRIDADADADADADDADTDTDTDTDDGKDDDGIARVARRLDRLHRKLRDAARHFDTFSDDERHAVRKRAKRLRYLAELARPLFATREVDAYLKRLKRAQQRLGDYQDLCTAADAYRRAAREGQHEAWFGAGWLQAVREQHVEGCHRALRRAARAERFW